MVDKTFEKLKDSETLSRILAQETLDEVNWFALPSRVHNVVLIDDSSTLLKLCCNLIFVASIMINYYAYAGDIRKNSSWPRFWFSIHIT